jgi:uncharacterized protein YdgA (DUF945 family)
MKKFFVAVTFLLATLVIAPKFIGDFVESEREKLLTALNESEGITLVTTHYNGGWFGANATSEMLIQLESDGMLEFTITVEEKLSFGPVIITDSNWHLGLGYSALNFSLAGFDVDKDIINIINEKLHVGALLAFNKEVTTFINTDKLSYQDIDGMITSEPASAEITISNKEHIEMFASWGGLEVKDEGESLVIGAVDMSTKQQVALGDYLKGTAVLTGDASLNVAGITFHSDNSKVFSLEEMSLTNNVSLDDDLLALVFNYQAKEMFTSGQSFKAANLNFILANIDIKALQKLNTITANLPVSTSGQDNSDQIIEALSVVVEKVLVKDPYIKITDLSVVTDEGKVSSEFTFNMNKDLFDMSRLNSMAFITALEAQGKAKAPVNFLNKLGMTPMVDSLVDQGYLNRQENNITVEAKYVESELIVNGKLFQL